MFEGRVSREDGLECHQFCKYAASRPHINLAAVGGGVKDEFGGAVVSGTDIRDVILAVFYDFSRAEVANLDFEVLLIDEYVWRFQVTVTYIVKLRYGGSTSK